MDAIRMVSAGMAVVCAAGGAALAWRCRRRGYVGRKRVLSYVGAAALVALAVAGEVFAFVPRTTYISPDAPDEGGGEPALAEENGSVVYSTASLGVPPASPDLPEGEGEAEPEPDGGDTPPEAEPTLGDGAVEPEGEPAGGEPEAPSGGQDATGQPTPATAPVGTGAAVGGGGTTTAQTVAAAQPSVAPLRETASVALSPKAGSATVDFLDQGAGTCALVTMPDGTRVLIGAGDEERTAATVARLAELGVDRLDMLVLTGPSDSEVGGAAELMAHVRIAEVVVPESASERAWDHAYGEAARTGTPVSNLGAARGLAASDGASLEAISLDSEHLAVRLTCGGRTALFCGTAAPSQVSSAAQGRVDVIDVPGDGSGDAVSAEDARSMWPFVAVVSAGHSEETLSVLGMARLLNTDGSWPRVTIDTNGTLAFSS